VVVSIALFALLFETVVAELRGTDTPLYLFVYQRSLVHLAGSALLVSSYLAHRFWKLSHASLPQLAVSTQPTGASAQTPGDEIEVMTGTGRASIRVDEIECLQADRNYINVVHVSGRTYLLRQTMAAAERSLDEARFVRIHRSTIVNRRMIKERRPGGVLVLQSGRTVSVSRAYRGQLRPEA
jgi:DNA-binding LytR/AlgR family response regulator